MNDTLLDCMQIQDMIKKALKRIAGVETQNERLVGEIDSLLRLALQYTEVIADRNRSG